MGVISGDKKTKKFQKKIKVGFFCIYAQNYFDRINECVGGAEKQAVLMAKALAENQGFYVNLMVADPGKSKRRKKFPWGINYVIHPRFLINGKIIRETPSTGNLFKLRDKIRSVLGLPLFLSSEINEKKIHNPFYRLNVDLWVCVSLNDPNYELANYCMKNKKPLIVVIAANIDFDFLDVPTGKDIYDADRTKKMKMIEMANAIVVQNQFQANLMKIKFPSKKSYFLPNPISVEPLYNEVKPDSINILWVGRFDINKNPLLFSELARKLPNYDFIMISNPSDEIIEKKVRSSMPSNLKIFQSIPVEKMNHFYSESAILVNTSTLEGFPNTFLEAAALAVPTYSLNVDPNNLLSEEILGKFFGGDLEAMALALKSDLSNPKLVKKLGLKARSYVEEVHDIQKVNKRWLEIVDDVLNLSCVE